MSIGQPLNKYSRERQDADGEPLFWPGGPEGWPFRGRQPPQTHQEEFDTLQPVGKLRCRVFYLDNDDDVKAYTIVRDKCANHLFVPVDRDRAWDPERKTYRIFLEWLEMAYELPPKENLDAIHQFTAQPQGINIPLERLAGVAGETGGRSSRSGW